MWAIDSNQNPDETNEKWSEFSAKVRKLWQWLTPACQNRWFLRDGTLVVFLTKHNSGHVARIGTELPGRSGPLRILTRTFLKVSFLLEPAAFTPTWIRPLRCSRSVLACQSWIWRYLAKIVVHSKHGRSWHILELKLRHAWHQKGFCEYWIYFWCWAFSE